MGVRKVGGRRDHQFAREGHDRALERHQQDDERIAIRLQRLAVPISQPRNPLVHGACEERKDSGFQLGLAQVKEVALKFRIEHGDFLCE